jgi:hypothetical protein
MYVRSFYLEAQALGEVLARHLEHLVKHQVHQLLVRLDTTAASYRQNGV